MERYSVVSSSLKSVGYDVDKEILEIEFIYGAVYQYLKVPEQVYKDLMHAPSKGRFYLAEIKDKFAYQKIDAGKRG